MEVILLEKHAKLGELGNIIRVKNGYARNFLIPQKKAIRATKENKEAFEARRASIQKEVEEKISAAVSQSEKIVGKHISIITQASDDGKLYGSVTPATIAAALNEDFGLELTKSNIVIDDQIKFTGEYKIKIAFYADVIANVKVIVARSAEEAEVILSGKLTKTTDNAKENPSEEFDAQNSVTSTDMAEEGVEVEENIEVVEEEAKIEEDKPIKKSTNKKSSS